MRIVGLTGGIASGKSTVSNLFKENSIPVVDADLVARDVLKKGTGGWKKVVSAFGEDILQLDGEVDRPKLGQIVFSNPEWRQPLNRVKSSVMVGIEPDQTVINASLEKLKKVLDVYEARLSSN